MRGEKRGEKGRESGRWKKYTVMKRGDKERKRKRG